MRINEILGRDERESYGQSVSKDLTPEEFQEYMPDVELALEKFVTGDIIYRGIDSTKDILLVNPTLVERKAANTSNYANLLVSNLPSWSDYPPRNKSLICSGDRREAAAYAATYTAGAHIVLPLGNPKIGIVNASDFWRGFNQGISPTDINYYLGVIYEHAVYLVRPESKEQLPTRLPDTKDKFFEALKFIKEVQMDFPDIKEWKFTNHNAHMERIMSQPILQSLEELLNPTTNQFQLRTLSTYTSCGSEVWISAPCILIKRSNLEFALH